LGQKREGGKTGRNREKGARKSWDGSFFKVKYQKCGEWGRGGNVKTMVKK